MGAVADAVATCNSLGLQVYAVNCSDALVAAAQGGSVAAQQKVDGRRAQLVFDRADALLAANATAARYAAAQGQAITAAALEAYRVARDARQAELAAIDALIVAMNYEV